MERYPRITTTIGTIASLLGAVTVLYNWDRPDYQSGFFAGGLLVVGGLLLRIEGAVREGYPHRDR